MAPGHLRLGGATAAGATAGDAEIAMVVLCHALKTAAGLPLPRSTKALTPPVRSWAVSMAPSALRAPLSETLAKTFSEVSPKSSVSPMAMARNSPESAGKAKPAGVLARRASLALSCSVKMVLPAASRTVSSRILAGSGPASGAQRSQGANRIRGAELAPKSRRIATPTARFALSPAFSAFGVGSGESVLA